MNMRSKYMVWGVTSDAVHIVDLANHCDNAMTVTNDAENVVANVAATYGNRRIMYRDTNGQWDELVHDNGRFIRFAPGNAPA